MSQAPHQPDAGVSGPQPLTDFNLGPDLPRLFVELAATSIRRAPDVMLQPFRAPIPRSVRARQDERP